MRDLLLGNRPIVEKHFSDGSTSNEQLALIFNELDRGECVAPTFPSVKSSEPASMFRATDFECHLSDDLLAKIKECINCCHLEKPRVFDPRGQSPVDPLKSFLFDP